MKQLLFAFFLLPLFTHAQIINTFAGCGIGDDSVGTSAELFYPHSVALDSAGNMYIAEVYGCRVRKMSASGIITTIAGTGISGYSGDGCPAVLAQLAAAQGVAVDKAGNVFIADEINNRIRKISTSGIISTCAGNGVAGFSGDGGPAISAELNEPLGISVDAMGNLYIADAFNNRIRKVDTAGTITTVAGNGVAAYTGDGVPATSTAIRTPFDAIADKKGNLYVADFNNNRIRKIDTGGMISTIAGTGVAGYSGDGGPANLAEIKAPNGVVVDTFGNVYFSDAHNSRVRKIDTMGIITTIAGNGTPGYNGDGGLADSAEFCEPSGITIDRFGNIYIPDDWNNRIRKLTATGIITTVVGQNGFFDDGYSAVNAEIGPPNNIAVDTSGNIYIADIYNNRIRKVNAVSGVITTVAGRGIAGFYIGFSGDGGPADSAHIFMPAAVAVDIFGNIYIADNGNYRIRKVNTSGIITTITGTGVPGFSGDGGAATAAQIGNASGVAVDIVGNVYIADPSYYRIRKINTAGLISTIAGNGSSGYGGDGGAATLARIDPYDLTVDASGNVFIADGANNRIRKVDTSGVITTLAGNGVAGYSGDGGLATAAEINSPDGIKVDETGNIYFSDNSNHVRMIDSWGIINTIAGDGSAGFSGDGGIATAAELNGPSGVAIDRSGNVYIADGYNYRIRKITNALSVPISKKGISENIDVYPNPATAFITISASDRITTITIIDLLGQTLYTEQYNAQHIQVDVSTVPPGVYFVKVNGVEVRKFVKQ